MWHSSRSTLAQVLAWCLMAPSHYPCYRNQCWLLIVEVLWHSPESIFTASAHAPILQNEFETILFKLLPHLPGSNELKFEWRGGRVSGNHERFAYCIHVKPTNYNNKLCNTLPQYLFWFCYKASWVFAVLVNNAYHNFIEIWSFLVDLSICSLF